MIFHNHFQNAYVTRDLDKSIELMQKRYGIGHFLCMDPDIEVMTPEGPRQSICRAALGWADPEIMIELIEPVGGTVDIYSELLPGDDSPRFHHAAMRVDDWDAMHQHLETQGWRIAIEHHMPEGLNFMYVDARDTIGHYLEYVWATPDMWAYIKS